MILFSYTTTSYESTSESPARFGISVSSFFTEKLYFLLLTNQKSSSSLSTSYYFFAIYKRNKYS